MYGKLQERKLNQQDFIMSCEVVRTQLSDYINQEAKRVNVDSAKKRAVLQRMDYEGFRQMVLGANLFSIKSKQLMKFSEGNHGSFSRPDTIVNPSAITFNKNKTQSQQVLQKNQVVLEKLLENQLTKQTVCNNFSEFKKQFNKHYTKELSDVEPLYQILKDQNIDRLSKIFTSEFDPIYFVRICQVFQIVIRDYIIPQKNINDLFFILTFLETLSEIKNFNTYIMKLLPKTQKAKVDDLILSVEEAYKGIREQLVAEERERFESALSKIMGFYAVKAK